MSKSQRHLQIPNIEEKSFTELLHIYNTFLLPLAPRIANSHREAKYTVRRKSNNKEDSTLCREVFSSKDSPDMQEKLLNQYYGCTGNDCTDDKTKQNKVGEESTKSHNEQLRGSLNKKLSNTYCSNKDVMHQPSYSTKRHEVSCQNLHTSIHKRIINTNNYYEDNTYNNTFVPATKRIKILQL